MRLLIAIALTVFIPVLSAATPQVPDSCPVTRASEPAFHPPAAVTQGAHYIGTANLWTVLPSDGTWSGLPHYTPDDPSFRQKLLWWSELRDPQEQDHHPRLIITGTRLDGPAPPLASDGFINRGFSSDGGDTFMVVGISIPTLGCWKITGRYLGEELSYVVWVSQDCSDNDLAASITPSDPAYEDAADVARRLRDHGFVVKCVLQSKMANLFEDQTGAALFRTDHGNFEGLFLPQWRNFASLSIAETHSNGRSLYAFRGDPHAISSKPIDSPRPMYFQKHGNALFISEQDEAVRLVVNALN